MTRQLTLLVSHPTMQVALSRGHRHIVAPQIVHSSFVSHIELRIWQVPDYDQEEVVVKSSFHLLNQRGDFEMTCCFVKMPSANVKVFLCF
jgi:hypothetical protein